MQAAFFFDQNRCTGCQACVLGCTIENRLPLDRSWREVLTFNEDRHPNAPVFHLSLACNHCAEPACMYACPALAYSKDPDTGAVLLEPDKCIGCRYCTWACPYDAPRWDAASGTVSKCTFCDDRLRTGRAPACAAVCPTGALSVVELDGSEPTRKATGFPVTDLEPSIKIVPLRGAASAPEPSAPPPLQPATAARDDAAGKISLRSEWSLLAFSSLAVLLVSSLLATVVAATSMGVPAAFRIAPAGAAGRPAASAMWPLEWWWFALTGALALALSTAHLGRKLRAWRAILNLRRSWLSREVVSFSLFLALGTAYMMGPGWQSLGWSAALVGLLVLLSIDRVYRYALRPWGVLPHSAGVVLTGLFLAALFAGHLAVVLVLGLVKLALYGARKVLLVSARRAAPLAGNGGAPAPALQPAPTIGAPRAGQGASTAAALALLRVGVGLALPALLRWSDPAGTSTNVLVLAAVLFGEILDRCELYAELEIMTPALQMSRDLRERLGAGLAGRPATAA